MREQLLNGDVLSVAVLVGGLLVTRYLWKWTRPDRLVRSWVQRG